MDAVGAIVGSQSLNSAHEKEPGLYFRQWVIKEMPSLVIFGFIHIIDGILVRSLLFSDVYC